jgi:hypothetical protein
MNLRVNNYCTIVYGGYTHPDFACTSLDFGYTSLSLGGLGDLGKCGHRPHATAPYWRRSIVTPRSAFWGAVRGACWEKPKWPGSISKGHFGFSRFFSGFLGFPGTPPWGRGKGHGLAAATPYRFWGGVSVSSVFASVLSVFWGLERVSSAGSQIAGAQARTGKCVWHFGEWPLNSATNA